VASRFYNRAAGGVPVARGTRGAPGTGHGCPRLLVSGDGGCDAKAAAVHAVVAYVVLLNRAAGRAGGIYGWARRHVRAGRSEARRHHGTDGLVRPCVAT
jgi:hypothetical protein